MVLSFAMASEFCAYAHRTTAEAVYQKVPDIRRAEVTYLNDDIEQARFLHHTT